MRTGFLAFCALFALLASAIAQPVAPYVIASPMSVAAYPGDSVTLSTTIGGDPPITFQWRKDGVAIAGATNSTFVVVASLTNPSSLYDVVATQNAGTPSAISITTAPALVFVSKRPQTIIFDAPAAVAAAGSGVTLTATASSGLPITFTLVSGVGSMSGNLLVGAGGEIVVRATQAGDATYAAAEPVERTINFVVGALSPFITTFPSEQTPTAGSSVTLRTTAIGTPTPTYQWQKDGLDLPGATSASLQLSNVTLADSGRYTVIVSNLAGTASANVQVNVRAAPTVTTPPASQSVAAGNPVSLSIEAAGYPAITYQWRRNGTAIAGATTATYTLTNTLGAHAGDYDVVLTNALGTVTSPVATLTVITRDFSGTYFGSFANSAGEAVLWVRGDGTAAFFGHLPALSTGLATLTASVDLSGNLSATLPTIAATSRNVALRGTIDEVAGTVTGTIADLAVSFTGTRAAPRDPPVTQTGLYTAAFIGSGADRGYVIVAADGRGVLFTATGTAIEIARGNLDASGRLIATTSSQATIDLGFTDGVLRGTARLPNGTTGVVAGAIESLAGAEHLVNLSVRSTAVAVAPLITGFAIGGTAAKQVLIRAAGPALGRAPFNLAGVVSNPTLQLFRVNTVIAQNTNWGSPSASAAAITAATTRVGAFPFANGSSDAALLTTLPPGVYSVQIGGGAGVVLAEIYEVPATNEAPGARRLVNASTRGVVAPNAPLIAGFVIGGTAPQRVLVRAAGPALAGAPFNLASTLPNPQLTIYRGSTAVRTNDDWFRDSEAALIRQAATRVRAFAFGNQSLDAALLTYLEPGAYTATVTAPANAPAAQATGIVLVEIYEVSP